MKSDRTNMLRRLRRRLRAYGLRTDDIGLGTNTRLCSDAAIAEALEEFSEDDARQAGDEAQRRESLQSAMENEP